MAAKRIMDVYPGHPFHITIAKYGMADAHLPKHQNVGKVAKAPKETFHIKDAHFSNPSGATATRSDSIVNSVLYQHSPEHLNPTAEHEAERKKDVDTLKKGWRGDVQGPAKIAERQPAFIICPKNSKACLMVK